ncbi:MAG: putative ATP-grasp-modified RiPP [Pseudonocardiaceae bacterium]
MTTALTRFADDPLASDSAQFPLARPMGMPESVDPPSPDAIRPWGLRWMEVLPSTGQRITMWRYDHEHQVAVDSNGTPLSETRMGAPTANKVTSNDGDEGPSEDFTYDFAPDTPFSPA